MNKKHCTLKISSEILQHQKNFALWRFADLVNMDAIWHRGLIRYLQKKGLAPKEIHADKVATLGDDAPALSTVKKWAAEFKRGRKNLQDDPRSGGLSTTTTQENIDRIHQIAINDRRLTVNHIANVMSISRERVENILHKELDMSKVLVQWVLRL